MSRESDATFAVRTRRIVPDWPEQAYQAAWGTAHRAAHTVPLGRRQEKLQSQAELVRCIFGSLRFHSITAAPSWLTPSVVSLARQMYDSRDFCPMPTFADALEEAGCDNTDILAHCRQPGEHVRGCWVVDLLLGKG